MKGLKIVIVLFSILILSSCNKDEEINVAPVINNATVDIRGFGVEKGDLITTIIAKDANKDQLQYTILSQTRVGRSSINLIINPTTGEVLVDEPTSFVFNKSNTNRIETVINAYDGQLSTNAKLTISITDPN
jgi:hypothetical protein